MKIESVKKIIFKLMRVDRLHKSILDDKTKGFKLHRSKHRLLFYLIHLDDAPSQIEIAESLGVSAVAVAHTIKKLEEDGFVKKIPSTDDKRINFIKITPKGISIMKKTKEIFESVDNNVMKGIKKNDLDVMFKVLCEMEKNLIEMGAVDKGGICFKNNKHNCSNTCK